MCCACIPNYVELVSISLHAEQDGDRLSLIHVPMSLRPRPDLTNRSFLVKRPRADSSSRLTAPLTQPRQSDVWCTYCKRLGHTDTYCFTRMRNNGFAPPQKINRQLPQVISAPPLRSVPHAQPSYWPPPPRFKPPQRPTAAQPNRPQQAWVHSLAAEASEITTAVPLAFEVITYIQGIPVFLLVETGSTISIISSAAVKRLLLETTPMVGVRSSPPHGPSQTLTRFVRVARLT